MSYISVVHPKLYCALRKAIAEIEVDVGKHTCGIFYAKDTNRFLLAFRSNYASEPHTWGTWCCALHVQESPKDAMKREIKEETKYWGSYSLKPLFVQTKDAFKKLNFLIVIDNEFEPSLNWEIEKFGWFRINEFPTPLNTTLKTLLPYIDIFCQQNPC